MGMAEPTEKSPEVDRFLSNMFGISRAAVIQQNQCVICGADADEFDDDLSRVEYTISGMCQKCQNFAFGEE